MAPTADHSALTKDNLLRIIIALLAVLVLDRIVAFLNTGRDLFIPFVISLFLSILLSPILDLFEKKRIPKAFSILVALGLALIVLGAVFQILYQTGATFVEQVLKRQARFEELFHQIVAFFGLPADLFSADGRWLENPKVTKWLGDLPIGGTVGSILSSLQGFLSETLLVLLFLLFLLMGRGQLGKKIQSAFPSVVAARIIHVISGINRDVRKYLGVKAMISLAVGTLTTVVLFSFGTESPIIWGILAALFNFIPNVGSLLGMLLPVLFALVQFDSPVAAVWIFVVLLAIHFVIGSVLEPKIMGRSVDLSPVVILFALIFWSFVWGIAGMFLAVPIMVVLKIILDNIGPLRPLGALLAEAERK